MSMRRLSYSVSFVLAISGILALMPSLAARQGRLAQFTLTLEEQLVRFTPSADVVNWRVQITNSQGQSVFDSGFVNSRALEWGVTDLQGQAIDSGLYDYTLTSQAPMGEGSRTYRGQLQVDRVRSTYRVSAGFGDAIAETAIAVVNNSETPIEPAASVAAAETRAEPARRAPDSLRQPIGGRNAFAPTSTFGGTTGLMTKWTDGPAGVLGDTQVYESYGSVIVGNASFKGNLQIFGFSNYDVFAGMGPDLINGPSFNFGYAGSSFGRSAGFFNVRPDASAIAPNPSLRFMTENVERMIIANDGNIGIGVPSPYGRFTVRGGGNPWAELFGFYDGGGTARLVGYENGQTYLSHLVSSSSTIHICHYVGYFATCGSAAEYVPTVSGSHGYPKAAELVSISPREANPYGDDHGPFVVAKSTTPCDSHLFGFIVNPASGADGKKLNEHYLPLAIYGYFPAKVTTENGAIRRGDAITSSSKPGYGMKAIGGCRVIGYALQDAEQDGTIQVFAHLDEQQPIDRTEEIAALKARNSELDARVAALEQAVQRLSKPPAPATQSKKPLRDRRR